MRTGKQIVNDMNQPSDFCRCFSLSEIQSATDKFSDEMLIGRGGYGNVYKGYIDDEAIVVAVKRLDPESKQGAKEFWTEIKTLYKLRHRHLINLIGYSEDNEEMILVYDYMTNGTLADHLYNNHGKKKGENTYHLTWKQRLDICIGAARGLDYLHEGTEQGVIHRDVKSTNILLDKNWVPKISDFGLSKMGVFGQLQPHLSTDVKGTFGYLDPQYFLTRRLTKKSDVYAFGVVLFEALCGRPPVDFKVEEEQCSLAQWVKQCMEKGIIAEIVDPSLSGQISTTSLKLFAKVANMCLHNHPKGRPTMAEVTRSLELVLASGENIPPPIGIITWSPTNIARFLVEGCEFGKKKLKNMNRIYKPSREFDDDPSTRKAIQVLRRFSLAEIRSATKNFDKNLILENKSYGTIYRGLVDNGNLQVAVKRWKDGRTSENLDIFNAEIRVLSQVHHLHIVSLIGYCIERNEILTVYDFMGNSNLHNHLYQSTHEPLPWEKRLEIVIGAARGLYYLHTGATHPIIHRNLNPNNILLDQNWVVKLADVEFPTVIPRNLQSTSFNPSVACTVGYMDPEYVLRGIFSVKSDVYSFGVVLLELLCRRMPIIYSRDINQVNLVQWFKINMKMDTIDQVIDPWLIDKVSPECLKKYVKLLESCTCNMGVERPSMENVLETLQYAQQLQEAWQERKQSGAEFREAISLCRDLKQNLSPENAFNEGVLVLGTASQGDNTDFVNLDYSDHASENLAR